MININGALNMGKAMGIDKEGFKTWCLNSGKQILVYRALSVTVKIFTMNSSGTKEAYITPVLGEI